MTAKLSKAFYDKLGEQVASELVEWFNAVDATYRADLRELNELNFARFDAKVEQRMAQLALDLKSEFHAEISKVRLEMGEFRSQLHGEIGQLRQDMTSQISGLKTDLGSLRAELIKWAFVFFATAALAVIGLR